VKSRAQQLLDTYAIDSSVVVASLVPSDEFYSEGTLVVNRLLGSNDDVVYASAILPVEVCSAIARRSRDRANAREVRSQIASWVKLGRLRILYLNSARMASAAQIGIEYYLRGMDAIVAQAAREKRVPLVTFDLDFAERISPIVKTITQNNIMDEIAN
jgi:predicted nucleic acid-binding protein